MTAGKSSRPELLFNLYKFSVARIILDVIFFLTERALKEQLDPLKALVWFWLIDETLSANLVYQSDYEIGSTTLSNEAMVKIMMMVMAW